MIRERRWREGRRGWREVEIKGREGGSGREVEIKGRERGRGRVKQEM